MIQKFRTLFYSPILIKAILALIIINYSNTLFSQTSWESVGTLYSGNGVTVELQYKLKSDSCEPNSFKKSKYQYVLHGTLSGSDLYLNWKMDYYACNGSIMCQTNSVNIGKNDLGTIIQPDYVFDGYKIATPFYNDRISLTPDNTPVFSKGKLPTINQEIPTLNKPQDKSLDIIIKLKSYIDILKELKTLFSNDEIMKKNINAILESLSKKINDTLLN